MSAFEVVVLDYDGTLFDTRPAIVHCIQRAFEECGRPIPTLAGVTDTVKTGLPLPDTLLILDDGLRDDQAALDKLVETSRQWRKMRRRQQQRHRGNSPFT
jgi:phosphoglycolate phosphatase-like HAD superfamily hydrolase